MGPRARAFKAKERLIKELRLKDEGSPYRGYVFDVAVFENEDGGTALVVMVKRDFPEDLYRRIPQRCEGVPVNVVFLLE